MSALRDDRGRFTTRAQIAATEVLEAAVAEAVELIRLREVPMRYVLGLDWGDQVIGRVMFIEPPDPVVDMLAEATRSADRVLRREAS